MYLRNLLDHVLHDVLMNSIAIRTQDSGKPLVDFVVSCLPEGDYRRIFLKPNWVKHQEHPEFPISALVTDSGLIDAVIQACVAKYKNVELISAGDVPLQSCEFDLLAQQSGLRALFEKYRDSTKPRIQFLDLRRERWKVVNGFMQLDNDIRGDPRGYAEVVLGDQSLLEEISDNSEKFRVSDYDPKETTSVHRKGKHSYLIAGSILDADLIINMPKMKTHQKAGITGALKNLVGINGSKAYLVHHQKGTPKRGGDEFPDDVDSVFLWQTRLKERFQKRSKLLFKPMKAAWDVMKKAKKIETKGTRENLDGNFYIGAGSWYGNDSIWRMVYDLNMIIVFAGKEGGELEATPQREYVCILDGVVAGEGNGPLQPLPVHTSVIAVSRNPFLVDFAMAKMMGYDYRSIRSLNNYKRFPSSRFTDFLPQSFQVDLNGSVMLNGIDGIPTLHNFIPPPGWKNHIELNADAGSEP